MKKLFAVLAAVTTIGTLSAGPVNIKDNNAGYQLGTSPSQSVGFLGATPSVQLPAGTDPYLALQIFGFIATGGNEYSEQHVTVTLSAAQINGMYAAPVQLVAAPGSGRTILISRVAIRLTRTSTAFAAGGAAIIQYGNTVNGGGTQAADSTIASTFFTGAAGVSESARGGANPLTDQGTTLENTGIYLSNASGAFTTGTGTATADVWYRVF